MINQIKELILNLLDLPENAIELNDRAYDTLSYEQRDLLILNLTDCYFVVWNFEKLSDQAKIELVKKIGDQIQHLDPIEWQYINRLLANLTKTSKSIEQTVPNEKLSRKKTKKILSIFKCWPDNRAIQ